ncbi:MAG: GNAT family N-acetyltransferase [Asgard group archaeon]|nr:GNAT family N-acetyltransferase [Asgard group archaeon]
MHDELDFYYANSDDLESIYPFLELTGWGEKLEDINQVLLNPSNKYIALIDSNEGEMFGITLAVNNAPIGFIGHVIVKPEFRGMGLGEQLMIEAIDYLKRKGCKTIKLDAVPKAESLYKRVGFKNEINSLRYVKELPTEEDFNELESKLQEVKGEHQVFNCEENDLEELFKIDKEIFGVNRNKFMMSLYEEFPEITFIARDEENKIIGYQFGTFRDGILKLRMGYATTFELVFNLINSAILKAKELGGLILVKVGLLENSTFGVKAVELLGFEHVFTSLRMYYGEQTTKSNNPLFFAIGDPAKG